MSRNMNHEPAIKQCTTERSTRNSKKTFSVDFVFLSRISDGSARDSYRASIDPQWRRLTTVLHCPVSVNVKNIK